MRNIAPVMVDRIRPIVEPLHEAFEFSRERFSQYPGIYRQEDQPWLRTHLMRAFLWQHLCSNPIPTPWKLTGNHRQNGAINLAFSSGEMKAKFVHVFPAGHAPPAGTNTARRAYYTNRAIAEMSDPNHMPTHNLLLTWEEHKVDEPFELTIIRPLSTGSLHTHVKADFYLPLPRVVTAFEQQEFDTRDEDETLDYDVDQDDLGGAGE